MIIAIIGCRQLLKIGAPIDIRKNENGKCIMVGWSKRTLGLWMYTNTDAIRSYFPYQETDAKPNE